MLLVSNSRILPSSNRRNHRAARKRNAPHPGWGAARPSGGVGPASVLVPGAADQVHVRPLRRVLVALAPARAVVGARHVAGPERGPGPCAVPRQRDVHVCAVAVVVVHPLAQLAVEAAVVLLPPTVPGAP